MAIDRGGVGCGQKLAVDEKKKKKGKKGVKTIPLFGLFWALSALPVCYDTGRWESSPSNIFSLVPEHLYIDWSGVEGFGGWKSEAIRRLRGSRFKFPVGIFAENIPCPRSLAVLPFVELRLTNLVIRIQLFNPGLLPMNKIFNDKSLFYWTWL